MKVKSEPKLRLTSRLYNHLFRETLFPLLIMMTTPNLTLLLSFIIIARNSNLKRCFLLDSIDSTLTDAWNSVHWFDIECWSILVGVLLWGVISLHFPGPEYFGPPTTNGFIPKYWNNGFRFYCLSMIIAIPVIAKTSVLHLYYKIPTFIAILMIFGFAVCIALYIKGLLRPDPGICDITKNPIFDYYWGIELYPHLGPYISLKLLIICRFGLFLWQLIVLIAWKANYEMNPYNLKNEEINYPLTASTILQTIYLAKFYYWEDGYMMTIDTTVDRFGFYVAWGCIAFVPGFYTLTSLYLVKHSPVHQFGVFSFMATLSVGLIVIGLNYWSDRQKQKVRATNGKCNIWGKPAKIIRVSYIDDFGKNKKSILLASGFWGLTRHMNYTFELMVTLVWCLPSLLTSPIPYLYFIFLVILLIHRSVRDDNKCSKKYGVYWDQYKELVKYQMIPGIY